MARSSERSTPQEWLRLLDEASFEGTLSTIEFEIGKADYVLSGFKWIHAVRLALLKSYISDMLGQEKLPKHKMARILLRLRTDGLWYCLFFKNMLEVDPSSTEVRIPTPRVYLCGPKVIACGRLFVDPPDLQHLTDACWDSVEKDLKLNLSGGRELLYSAYVWMLRPDLRPTLEHWIRTWATIQKLVPFQNTSPRENGFDPYAYPRGTVSNGCFSTGHELPGISPWFPISFLSFAFADLLALLPPLMRGSGVLLGNSIQSLRFLQAVLQQEWRLPLT